MHDIEPYSNWIKYYDPALDIHSPFYGATYNLDYFSTTIYGYYIHPLWDSIGSETLFLKMLYADYNKGFVILEIMGEWNDALNNDIMHLKRNIVDHLIHKGINKYILIGENVFIFHGSDDCYYEEWFEDIEDGWIAGLNFRYFVTDEWNNFNIDTFIHSGGSLEINNWRTLKPHLLFQKVNTSITRRLDPSNI